MAIISEHLILALVLQSVTMGLCLCYTGNLPERQDFRPYVRSFRLEGVTKKVIGYMQNLRIHYTYIPCACMCVHTNKHTYSHTKFSTLDASSISNPFYFEVRRGTQVLLCSCRFHLLSTFHTSTLAS